MGNMMVPSRALCFDLQNTHRDVRGNATDLCEYYMKANALFSKITSSEIKHRKHTPMKSMLKYIKCIHYALYPFTEVLIYFVNIS